MKERFLTIWKSRKVRIVTALLAISYAVLVKMGYAPDEWLWGLVKEVVFAFVG